MRKQGVDIWRKLIVQYKMSNCMMSTDIIDIFYSVGCDIIPHPLIVNFRYSRGVKPQSVLLYKICTNLYNLQLGYQTIADIVIVLIL